MENCVIEKHLELVNQTLVNNNSYKMFFGQKKNNSYKYFKE